MTRHLALILSVLALPGLAAAQQAPVEKSSLAIVSGSGRHEFTVEVAATPDQRARGLMFRRSLDKDAGMLFEFGSGGRASMWMKNTLIPLDMLFIAADGTIESIAQRTVPHSLAAINSKGAVRGVLELNGGTTARLGIKPGDRVEHAMFGTAE